ncbi:MAG: YraN family protein [Gemmatimonadota bacterium]
MATHNLFGASAESLAATFLEARGWSLLHRNWRWRSREIDIVARRGRLVAFVEVRARRSADRGHPFETIGRRKRRDLEIAARAWIAIHGAAADEYRFDAIAVLDGTGTGTASAGALVEYLADAWRG